MAGKFRILLDVNVVLDVLAKREPHYRTSAQVWAIVETGIVEGFLAAHSITTLYYLLSRHIGTQQAHVALEKILQVFSVATVDQRVILQALALRWPDFEDAVQMAAAIGANADYLITRNPKDFKADFLPVLQPGELLALLRAPQPGQSL
ncbi:MAG: PIN domain-containing protein [Caldilineae bacterium]|nr:MAG: PIN domain-containing protein [Caldilineae bacterium]